MATSSRGAIAGRNATARSSSSNKSSVLVRGDAGRDKVDEELERAKAKRESGGFAPFRVWMPPGSERQFIVLDDQPDTFLYEHTLMNPKTQRRDLYVPCLKEQNSDCPCCRLQDSTYVLLLSVIDLEPFTDSKGKRHDFSRKLMVVKPSQQKRFIRMAEREGTLRGALIEAHRDKETDAVIGSEHELIEMVSEEELDNDYMESREYQGKVTETNCGEPFDYDTIIKVYTEDQMERLCGLEPLPGSKRQVDKDLGRNSRSSNRSHQTDDWDEDTEVGGKGRSRPRSGRATSGTESNRTSTRTPTRVNRRTEPKEDQETIQPERNKRTEQTTQRRVIRQPAGRVKSESIVEDDYEDDIPW